MREFTREELSKYDGKQKEEIYVAYNGKIYDVTGGISWEDGDHFGHDSGIDLTEQMAEAPHEEEVFEDFEIVGILID
ncbi:cytochrome b5 domain-containing protein [Methanolobus sp. ZRKC2]|uniref:cytochrome b5 domain-containing protein n=1 Tax=Methanolobus sp. ZRKC2 TaxID=3125783 RepID=UPI0032494076